MCRTYSKDPKVETSLRHSVRDAVAHSAMSGAGESFFSAFALFLKATNAQIAMLASIPPLLASLAQLVSVWCGRFVQRRRSIILFGAYVQCFLWLPLLALPLLFPEHAVPLFITVIVFYQASSHLIAPQWSSLMGDLVPQRKRGRYFGMRTRHATVA
ncbi:MAG: MFS transporter, partial [Gammaproteobacteria bacterium]|nr:MFS transporter [Gammaproteobacteria bacterium]